MEKTHWLKNPNKNYLGHWDLPDNDLILTIKSAGWEEVIDPTKREGQKDYSQSKRVVHFEENYKPLICNQTNAISIYKSTGIRFLEDSQGAKIKLFIGEEIDRKNKITVECVRIRHDKVIAKEDLNPNHKSWSTAKEAYHKGSFTIEQIKGKYLLTLENEKLLCLKSDAAK